MSYPIYRHTHTILVLLCFCTRLSFLRRSNIVADCRVTRPDIAYLHIYLFICSFGLQVKLIEEIYSLENIKSLWRTNLDLHLPFAQLEYVEAESPYWNMSCLLYVNAYRFL